MAEARRFRYDEPGAAGAVGAAMGAVLSARQRSEAGPLVFLCIGTDRSTGDALGPLVGRQLAAAGLIVYGTLDQPVHASNLNEVLRRVGEERPGCFLVAVDACLGRLESVGVIAVGAGPLLPGAGVNKNLPDVGHAFVTGTVNVGGFMEYFVLQNTRLSLVIRMADVIAEGLCCSCAPTRAAGGVAHWHQAAETAPASS